MIHLHTLKKENQHIDKTCSFSYIRYIAKECVSLIIRLAVGIIMSIGLTIYLLINKLYTRRNYKSIWIKDIILCSNLCTKELQESVKRSVSKNKNQDIFVISEDDIDYECLTVTQKPEDLWMLYITGMGESIQSNVKYMIKISNECNINVICTNKMEVSLSTGKNKDFMSLVKPSSVALNYLLKKKVPLNKIIIMGYSLGGAIASEIAKAYPSCRLILDRVYIDPIETVINSPLLKPFFPLNYFCALMGYFSIKHNPKRTLDTIKNNTAVVFSQFDEVILYDESILYYLKKKSFFIHQVVNKTNKNYLTPNHSNPLETQTIKKIIEDLT